MSEVCSTPWSQENKISQKNSVVYIPQWRRLHSVYHTAESGSAVCIIPRSQAPQCASHRGRKSHGTLRFKANTLLRVARTIQPYGINLLAHLPVTQLSLSLSPHLLQWYYYNSQLHMFTLRISSLSSQWKRTFPPTFYTGILLKLPLSRILPPRAIKALQHTK